MKLKTQIKMKLKNSNCAETENSNWEITQKPKC